MADLIREALERLVVRLRETEDMEAVVPAWADSYYAAIAALAAEPPAPAEPDTDAVLALAAIIRRVDGSNSLGAAALAEAILSHPNVARVFQPPAPAPALPLDLDALLSPEGAYEPGTGREDGAQLVDQLEWWAPLHGCDTLENLLDRIRGRILPHLRPPIAGIDVPGTDGDYGGLRELCDAEGVDVRIGAPLLKRAREAWGATQPPAPVPVPVAERPWERPGWCDAEGRCWWFNRVGIPEWQLADGGPYGDFCLPHWAIPIPQPPQSGEVEQ